MAVLDASALIAAFADEPARQEVERILNERDARLSASNLVEIFDHLIRVRAESREDVEARFEALRRVRGLSVLPLDEIVAARAGELRAFHYHRVHRPVSHADCVTLATAASMTDVLATSDPHLANMAREEGVEVLALPDSSGKRPS